MLAMFKEMTLKSWESTAISGWINNIYHHSLISSFVFIKYEHIIFYFVLFQGKVCALKKNLVLSDEQTGSATTISRLSTFIWNGSNNKTSLTDITYQQFALKTATFYNPSEKVKKSFIIH